MTALRAFATALAWWAALTAVRGRTVSGIDIGLACVVAGALAGRPLRGALLSAALVAVAPSSPWAAAAGALPQRDGLGIGATLIASAPFLVPIAIGTVAGGVARRASAGRRGRSEAIRMPERAGWLGEFFDQRPDLALRARLLCKDWARAARLAETMGMPRSAARWWRAAGEPERARQVMEGASAVTLELAELPGANPSRAEPSPKLELENSQRVRFTIDPPDDVS